MNVKHHNFVKRIALKLNNLDPNQRKLPLKVAGGAISNFLLKICGTGLSFILPMILGRLLGADGYGAFAYTIAWGTVLGNVAVLGLDVHAIREIARAKTQSRWGVISGLISWSTHIVMLISFTISLVVGVLLYLLKSKIPENLVNIILLSLPLLLFLALIKFIEGCLQGLGRVVAAQWPMLIILPGGVIILSVFFYISGISLTAPLAIGAYILSAISGLIFGGYILWKELKKYPSFQSEKYVRVWLRSTLPFFLAGMITILNDRIGVLLLGTFVSADSAGVYDIVVKIARLIIFPLWAVNVVLAPTVATTYAKGKRKELQKSVRIAAQLSFVGSLIISLGVLAFGPWLLHIIGPEFSSGVSALVILSLGQLINAGSGSVGVILNMTGHERDALTGLILGSIVHILLLSLLLIPLKETGVAIARIIGLAVWNSFLIFRVHRLLQINPLAIGRKNL